MCFCVFLQRNSIGTTSVQYAHWFLKEMSDEVNQVITAICEEQCMLADKVTLVFIFTVTVYVTYLVMTSSEFRY